MRPVAGRRLPTISMITTTVTTLAVLSPIAPQSPNCLITQSAKVFSSAAYIPSSLKRKRIVCVSMMSSAESSTNQQ